MSAVSITAVNVLDNPAPFSSPMRFEIHYESLTDLKEDLDWKITYVGSAQSEEHDQVLEDISVGPVKAGKYKFVIEADAPDPKKIPKGDIVGVTVILLTCSYNGSEFLRVGYYASITYQDDELRENPPESPILDNTEMECSNDGDVEVIPMAVQKLHRTIVADAPRVTRFQHFFDDPEPEREDDGDEGAVEEAEDDLVVNADDLDKSATEGPGGEEVNGAANQQRVEEDAKSEDLDEDV